MDQTRSEIPRKELREFGFVLAGGVALMFGLFIPWLRESGYPWWPWAFAAVAALIALSAPRALGPLYRGWIKVGSWLGWINSRIILGIVFYIVVLPMGLVMRLTGKDPMARSLDSHCKTYRVKSADHPRERLEKPF